MKKYLKNIKIRRIKKIIFIWNGKIKFKKKNRKGGIHKKKNIIRVRRIKIFVNYELEM